jgi:hypothetical protein
MYRVTLFQVQGTPVREFWTKVPYLRYYSCNLVTLSVIIYIIELVQIIEMKNL